MIEVAQTGDVGLNPRNDQIERCQSAQQVVMCETLVDYDVQSGDAAWDQWASRLR